ncbi:MAG: tRNA lysidine(34) synthetase TilS, partial [Oscillospiraceae bacterium]|nr:tRNA lysidine(34) synthetase TilS [Oscillospiraceae bacterium]
MRQYCRSQALFEQGDRVIAAVSGGADSMALLLFLLANRAVWGLTVEAVHVNHGLRGAAAEQDEAFVTEFCQRNSVPLYIYRLAEEEDIPEQAGEDWARQARYRRFEALAREKQAKIATAHTLNDQAETLLFRLARGAGVKGAGAIPPKRGPFVRPFLGLRREATEYLCRQAGVEFCTDETNDTDRYARNLLRHKALPAMAQANSGALEAMARFCEQMRQMDSYLNARGEKLLRRAALEVLPEEETPEWAGGLYCAKSLRIAPAPERAAALRLLVGPAFEPEARHIALMEEALL